MTEFFNKKEEILEVQLTEYGKYLLSLGRLSPVYYAFYDDDILYNSEWAGVNEEQNSADRRIRYETPNLKVIPTKTGAETRVARFQDKVSQDLAGQNSDPAAHALAFQQESFIERTNSSSYPLGTALMTTDKTAAWTVGALHNTIDSTKEYIISNPSSSYADKNHGVITRIPQLNIDVNYKIFFQKGEFSEFAISDYFLGATETNIYLSLERDYLVLDILEGNTSFAKENFEVEVFFESETTGSSVSAPGRPLEQCAFTDAALSSPRPLGNVETNIGNVEYYFDLYLDHEIPSSILNKIGLTIDEATSTSAAAARPGFNRDLYFTTEDEGGY